MDMNPYHGQATLKLDDGTEHRVTVIIRVFKERGLYGWRGHIDASDDAAWAMLGDTATLALDDGRSGQILATNYTASDRGSSPVRFTGTGPLA